MGSWEDLFEGLKGDLVNETKEEVANLLGWAKSDTSDFVRAQGLKIEGYLNQLADGAITKDQFAGYMRDQERLLKMQKLKLQAAEKASAQRLIKGITKEILDRLLKLI